MAHTGGTKESIEEANDDFATSKGQMTATKTPSWETAMQEGIRTSQSPPTMPTFHLTDILLQARTWKRIGPALRLKMNSLPYRNLSFTWMAHLMKKKRISLLSRLSEGDLNIILPQKPGTMLWMASSQVQKDLAVFNIKT